MREGGPIRQRPSSPAALRYTGIARTLLGNMKNRMRLGGLQQMVEHRRVDDVLFTLKSFFGQDEVHIRVRLPGAGGAVSEELAFKRFVGNRVLGSLDVYLLQATGGSGKAFNPPPNRGTFVRGFHDPEYFGPQVFASSEHVVVSRIIERANISNLDRSLLNTGLYSYSTPKVAMWLNYQHAGDSHFDSGKPGDFFELPFQKTPPVMQEDGGTPIRFVDKQLSGGTGWSDIFTVYRDYIPRKEKAKRLKLTDQPIFSQSVLDLRGMIGKNGWDDTGSFPHVGELNEGGIGYLAGAVEESASKMYVIDTGRYWDGAENIQDAGPGGLTGEKFEYFSSGGYQLDFNYENDGSPTPEVYRDLKKLKKSFDDCGKKMAEDRLLYMLNLGLLPVEYGGWAQTVIEERVL